MHIEHAIDDNDDYSNNLSHVPRQRNDNIDNNSNGEGSREDAASLDRTSYSSIAFVAFEESSPN